MNDSNKYVYFFFSEYEIKNIRLFKRGFLKVLVNFSSIFPIMSHKEAFNLENFEKQDPIGKGGFSEVYKIKDKRTEQIYAAKICRRRLDKNTKEIKELKMNLTREVNILSQLHHAAILKFIGYSKTDFEEESKPVIVTEYLPNGTLRDIINLSKQNGSTRQWDDTRKLINIYGIASGISYLHSRDIIHRDLKPQNILEDGNLFPQIADFGLALISHQKQDGTVYQPNNKALGTPIYAAPEIWTKNAYSPASDVYSFGLIVYEIMTNEIPFQGFTEDKIFNEIIVSRYRPEFKNPIPDAYRNLIERCWSDNPLDRPSFKSIVSELRSNPGFITDGVDKSYFRDYAKFIDQFHTSFDPQKPILPFEEIQSKQPIVPLKEIEAIQKRVKIVKPRRSLKKAHRSPKRSPRPQEINNQVRERQQLRLKPFKLPPNRAGVLLRSTQLHLLPLVA